MTTLRMMSLRKDKKEEKNLNEVHMVENGVRKHQEKGQK